MKHETKEYRAYRGETGGENQYVKRNRFTYIGRDKVIEIG